MTYWAVVLEAAVLFPNWPAALIASAASWLCVGWLGAADALSYQTLIRTPLGFVAAVVPPLVHALVPLPLATPSQYCVTELFQELPPTLLKKLCWIAASPDGSLLVH